jgi:hypothetical protein
MSDQRLHYLLKELARELAEVPVSSEAERARLLRLRQEVERLLQSPEEQRLEVRNLIEALQRDRDLLELSYPTLTLLVERVTNALANLGL